MKSISFTINQSLRVCSYLSSALSRFSIMIFVAKETLWSWFWFHIICILIFFPHPTKCSIHIYCFFYIYYKNVCNCCLFRCCFFCHFVFILFFWFYNFPFSLFYINWIAESISIIFYYKSPTYSILYIFPFIHIVLDRT